MASQASTVNSDISTYSSSFSSFLTARHSLITTINGYVSNTSTALILESKTRKEYWIIFVKQSTPKSAGGKYYDIDIAGTGLHFTLGSTTTISAITTACSSFPAASSFTDNIVKLEFYGLGKYMTISSVIQKSTLSTDDDINDIAEFTKTQFDNLCWGLGMNSNTMPLT